MKKYLTFPSRAPYAWLIYWLVGGIFYRLQLLGKYYFYPFKSTYSIEFIVCIILFLSGVVLSIMANIQILVNLIRYLKKEERLTAKKLITTVLVVLVIYLIYNPLANNFLHYLTNNIY